MKFLEKEPIERGWSGDLKYRVTAEDGSVYLLRITPHEKKKNREGMFRMQQQVAALGVPMCQPLEYGVCEEGEYTLQSWIDGVDAEEVIPTLSQKAQYDYGVEAGEILKRIHQIPAPVDQPDWAVRFNAKIDRKIKMYTECPIHFDGAEHLIDYLNANRYLLEGRPQCYQHGDYHIGNMMIEDGHVKIIDFDRYDFGDPWEEFNRIVWAAQASPAFAAGMVDGYFDGDVSMLFWKLLALYISSNMLSSIPWAIPFGEADVQKMLEQAKDVLDWYDRMNRVIPSWYQSTRQ